MRTLGDIGAAIERQLDSIERRFCESLLRSMALGALLALGVVGGGIATFVLVFVVLVRFFS